MIHVEKKRINKNKVDDKREETQTTFQKNIHRKKGSSLPPRCGMWDIILLNYLY